MLLDCHIAPHLPLDRLKLPRKYSAPLGGGTAPVGNLCSTAALSNIISFYFVRINVNFDKYEIRVNIF